MRYAPLSPKKILEYGKLKNKKINKIIIWPVIKKENSWLALFRLMYARTTFIIKRLIDNRPLKPSIKFAPFIINKKQKSTKIEENKWLFIKNFKNWISTFDIVIGKKNININSKKTITRSLFEGFIFIFKSSKKPIKNIEELIKIYSYKIFP